MSSRIRKYAPGSENVNKSKRQEFTQSQKDALDKF
jgi:hypothetical protein